MPLWMPVGHAPPPTAVTKVAFAGKPYCRIETPDGFVGASSVKHRLSFTTGTMPAGAAQGGRGVGGGREARERAQEEEEEASSRHRQIISSQDAALLVSYNFFRWRAD